VRQWDIWQVDWEHLDAPPGPTRRKPRPALIVSENPIRPGQVVVVVPFRSKRPQSGPTIEFTPNDYDWDALGLSNRCWLWPRFAREIHYAECLYKRGCLHKRGGEQVLGMLRALGLH